MTKDEIIEQLTKDFNQADMALKKSWWAKRTNDIDLLQDYSMWLTKNGYMDTDWKDEEPFAIDEYLKQRK